VGACISKRKKPQILVQAAGATLRRGKRTAHIARIGLLNCMVPPRRSAEGDVTGEGIGHPKARAFPFDLFRQAG